MDSGTPRTISPPPAAASRLSSTATIPASPWMPATAPMLQLAHPAGHPSSQGDRPDGKPAGKGCSRGGPDAPPDAWRGDLSRAQDAAPLTGILVHPQSRPRALSPFAGRPIRGMGPVEACRSGGRDTPNSKPPSGRYVSTSVSLVPVFRQTTRDSRTHRFLNEFRLGPLYERPSRIRRSITQGLEKSRLSGGMAHA